MHILYRNASVVKLKVHMHAMVIRHQSGEPRMRLTQLNIGKIDKKMITTLHTSSDGIHINTFYIYLSADMNLRCCPCPEYK